MGCPSCRNQLVDGERTSPTGRGFFIHKELPRLGASQQTEGQNWNLVLRSENREHTQTLLWLCRGFEIEILELSVSAYKIQLRENRFETCEPLLHPDCAFPKS